jgi:tetratricopeptide (TPR) repeat protein
MFFRLVGLVILLIPVWILVLVAVEEQGRKDKAVSGVQAALQDALVSEKQIGRIASLDRMDPGAPADHWVLAGKAVLSGDGGSSQEAHFVATMRTRCPHYGDASCWSLEGLDLPASEYSASPRTDEEQSGRSDMQRLIALQTELEALGFDPGPPDGSLGPRTKQALEEFVAAHGPADLEAMNLDLVTLVEVKGHMARGDSLFAKRDFHSAMEHYDHVLRLHPVNAEARYRRGLMYRTMGASDLAVREYDAALTHDPSNLTVLFDRGHANYEQGNYWAALADYLDSLGLRLLGDRYFPLRENVVAVGGQAADGLDAAWDWAKATLAEQGISIGESSDEPAESNAKPS